MTLATVPGTLVLGIFFFLFGMCCLEPVEVLGVIQLSSDTCDSPWNSCPGGIFPYLVCAALSQLKYSGLFNCPMTLATIPGSLVLGVYFLILICAAFIQLKYSGSFTCPMTFVTTLGAHVLGVSTLNDTRCNNDNQLQQSMELLFWWYFSLFGMCCLYPIEVLLFIYLSNGTCNNSSSSCLGDVFLKWHMLWHSPSTCNVIYCILFTSIFHLLSPQ